jgi:hypothetical protein
LLERRLKEESIDTDTLVEALVKELGPAAKTDFEAYILQGKTIVPDSGAFGPCFERRPATFDALGKDAEGKKVDGFEWVRVESLRDEQCRVW